MTDTRASGEIASTDTVIYEPGKITTFMEACEGQVRWNNRKLEQLWSVMGLGTTGAVGTVEKQWREVPTEISP